MVYIYIFPVLMNRNFLWENGKYEFNNNSANFDNDNNVKMDPLLKLKNLWEKASIIRKTDSSIMVTIETCYFELMTEKSGLIWKIFSNCIKWFSSFCKLLVSPLSRTFLSEILRPFKLILCFYWVWSGLTNKFCDSSASGYF